MKEMIKNFALEMFRVVYFATLPIVLTGINLETGAIHINFLLIKAVALVAVLKGIDRALHESGVAEKGLARF